MSGLYIHIPLCKSKCNYCDFYSVVSTNKKDDLISAICKEIADRRDYLKNKNINTIYFGGGTPSLLSIEEILQIFKTIEKYYIINEKSEITLECNPDDLKRNYLKNLNRSTLINRLSIGIQSFNDVNLKFLGRRHNAKDAISVVLGAKKAGFHNISIDLIYGIPGMKVNAWEQDILRALELDVQHISAYHLSYEQSTPIFKQLKKREFKPITELEGEKQYNILIDKLKKADYQHYEISNFTKMENYSKHNLKYWKNEEYIGIGPSAHSYNMKSRQWNISNINKYMNFIKTGEQYFETEILTSSQKYNEYILTGLRTKWGVSKDGILKFGEKYFNYFLSNISKYISNQSMINIEGQYYLSEKAMFISNSIISDLMWV